MRHTWRVDAPQHAVAHTFFMHEILAFAALHKAHKLPEQRAQYYSFGIHHQDLSIRGVREKLLNVTAHEAAAIVATSTLLTLSVFASTGFELNYPEIPSSQGAIEGILNIFNLMQGQHFRKRDLLRQTLTSMFRYGQCARISTAACRKLFPRSNVSRSDRSYTVATHVAGADPADSHSDCLHPIQA
jgi:hypothetical protein